jgi:hypothetical protein
LVAQHWYSPQHTFHMSHDRFASDLLADIVNSF